MPDESGTKLEEELLARAERTADDYVKEGRAAAKRILDEAAERVRLREQHEVQLAESDGDRVYRQRVQAAALGFDAELERLRWTLIQEVLGMLHERLTRFADDESTYRVLVRSCLASAARSIGRRELVVEMNARDLKRFEPEFGELAHDAAPEAHLELSRKPIDCAGGVVVQSEDERIRVDDTFDGRMRRLIPRLSEVIMDALFGSLGEMGASRG